MVGFITKLECAGKAKRVGALDFVWELRVSEEKRRRLFALPVHSINKKASRKAYDWPLNLEKLSRHKTNGAW